MAPNSSTIAWKIPWMEEPHGLQSMGSLSRMWLNDFTFTFRFHALEKEMATLSSDLAWRIPGTGEPGGLPSMGSHRVGQDWSDLVAAAAAAYYRVHGIIFQGGSNLLPPSQELPLQRIHAHIHTCAHTYARRHIHTCIQIHTYTHTPTHNAHTYIQLHTYMNTHTN